MQVNYLEPCKDDITVKIRYSVISAILTDIDKKLPKVPKRKLSKEEIAAKANLNVPNTYKQRYIDILFAWNHSAILESSVLARAIRELRSESESRPVVSSA